MAPRFDTWTYKDVTAAFDAAIAALPGGKPAFESNRKFVEQLDHWQEGETWVGPVGNSPEVRAKILKAVQQQFCVNDIINEVLDNAADGLLKQEAIVTFAPLKPAAAGSAEEKSQQEEAAALSTTLAGWWDSQRLWEKMRTAVRRSRWATRGALRVWLPPNAYTTTVNDGKEVPALARTHTFEAALALIQLQAPEPGEALVYRVPGTADQVGLWRYEVGNDAAKVKKAELWYLDGENTVVRVVTEGSSETTRFSVPLGGRITIAEMMATALINKSIRDQQNRLNYFETVVTRTMETAGFPERYTMNAQPQGMWLDTKPTTTPALAEKVVDGKKWYLYPAPRAMGASVVTELLGLEATKADGGRGYETPGVVFKEPTDPEFAIKGCKYAEATIFRRCKQGHFALDDESAPSGESRKQSRTKFEGDITAVKAPAEGMLRDVLTSAIALAEFMANKTPGQGDSILARFRVVVNLRVWLGPISPDEAQEVRENRKAGLLSEPTAMGRLGIEDTDDERARIASDPVALADLWTKRGTAITALTTAGAGFLQACHVLGMTEDEAKVLQRSDMEGADVDP